MINYFEQNPMLMFVSIFVVVCLVCIFLLKRGDKKKKKSSKTTKKTTTKKDDSAKEPKPDLPDEKKIITTDEEVQEIEKNDVIQETETKNKSDNSGSKLKKKKLVKRLKPEITRVYEKQEHNNETNADAEYLPSISEEELLSNMHFEQTDGGVSKLIKTQKSDTHDYEDEIPDFEEFVLPASSDTKSNHFDKNRRISRCVQCGFFDDMFCSHISKHYLNIDADRHLKIGDNFDEKLYDRAMSLVAHGSAKIDSGITADGQNADGLSRKESMKSWIENKKREEFAKLSVISSNQPETVVELCDHDELNLSTKNILVVDALLNRKGKNKK